MTPAERKGCGGKGSPSLSLKVMGESFPPIIMIRVAVPKELGQGEKRVALVPEAAGRLVKAGFEVRVESGAGMGAYFPDEHYTRAGVKIIRDIPELYNGAQIILKVQAPKMEEIDLFPEGSILVGLLTPHRLKEELARFKEKKITAFALEKLPRITRAQAMDVLSSQATVAGYKAALIAADLSSRFFPMLTTAAGTIRPAKVLVLGAGVAGLQAIATSKRLGAVVEAYDVRRAVKEQVLSLGARFLEIPVDAEAQGGYARELTEEEKKAENTMLSRHVELADVVITTAQVPGKPAPRLLTEEMVSRMKPGSVVVDMAAESGGNCAVTKAGETIHHNGVLVAGPLNLPGALPVHASEMLAKNIFNFLMLLTKDGKSLEPDWSDEVIAGGKL